MWEPDWEHLFREHWAQSHGLPPSPHQKKVLSFHVGPLGTQEWGQEGEGEEGAVSEDLSTWEDWRGQPVIWSFSPLQTDQAVGLASQMSAPCYTCLGQLLFPGPVLLQSFHRLLNFPGHCNWSFSSAGVLLQQCSAAGLLASTWGQKESIITSIAMPSWMRSPQSTQCPRAHTSVMCICYTGSSFGNSS